MAVIWVLGKIYIFNLFVFRTGGFRFTGRSILDCPQNSLRFVFCLSPVTSVTCSNGQLGRRWTTLLDKEFQKLHGILRFFFRREVARTLLFPLAVAIISVGLAWFLRARRVGSVVDLDIAPESRNFSTAPWKVVSDDWLITSWPEVSAFIMSAFRSSRMWDRGRRLLDVRIETSVERFLRG